jgi:hypothetical protein
LRGSSLGRLARYAAVGALATAVHWAVLVAGVMWAHRPAWQASGLGAVLGAQVAFAGNRALTFEHRGCWYAAWWRFQGTAAFGALLSMGLVALSQAAGLHYLLGQALATAMAMVVTYGVNLRWSFAATRGPG